MYIMKVPEFFLELKTQMKIDPHHGHSFIHSFIHQQMLTVYSRGLSLVHAHKKQGSLESLPLLIRTPVLSD